jgi:protein tyrosine/serine phosphatase
MLKTSGRKIVITPASPKPEMPDFSEIVEGLFIGDVYAVVGDYRTLEQDILDILKIDVVISALTEDEYEDHMIRSTDFIGRVWHRFIIEDDDTETITGFCRTAHVIINRALQKNKKVMVHCKAGISRSATLVIAYLMIENTWQYEKAYEYVKKRRPIIVPNQGFITQLKHLESHLIL